MTEAETIRYLWAMIDKIQSASNEARLSMSTDFEFYKHLLAHIDKLCLETQHTVHYPGQLEAELGESEE